MSFVRSGAWNQFLGSIKSTWGMAKRTAKLTGATLFSLHGTKISRAGAVTLRVNSGFCTIQPYSMCMLLLGMVYGHLALCLHSVSCGCACGGFETGGACVCVACVSCKCPVCAASTLRPSSGHGTWLSTWRDLGSCISNMNILTQAAGAGAQCKALKPYMPNKQRTKHRTGKVSSQT